MDPALIRSLYRYNAWANQRLLATARRLPPARSTEPLGGSFGSVLATLGHILHAEQIWLGRWLGRSQPPDPPPASDLASLTARWTEHQAELDRFLDDLTSERLVAPLSYTTTGGQSFTQPLWQPLLHVVNHGTHHRSEAADLLTRLGHPPPPLDLIVYYRETQP